MRIGAQLYTVREYCKNTDGFAESLKKVADIGYKTVQVSGVCPYEPEWLKEQLDKNGLECVLTHTAVTAENAAEVSKNHDVFGCKYVGLGFYDFLGENSKGYDAFVKDYTTVARVLKENGKYFMYHNHDHEFVRLGDKIILQKLCEDMHKELMGFTLDTFWVQAGGADPALWLERLSGRVPCIHLKDFAYGRKMAPIGEGNLNWERIFKSAEAAKTEFMLVEQDDCNGEDPFDCLKRSYNYLKACGFR